jgi:hypothetical protein
VLLAIGLGIGSTSGWLASAEAQQATPAEKLTPDERVKRLEQQLEQAKVEAEAVRRAARQLEESNRLAAELSEKNSKLADSLSTAKWEYSFVPVSPMDAVKFVKLLQHQESRGWDYSGQTTLVQQGKDTVMWVFRQPKKKPMGIQVIPDQPMGVQVIPDQPMGVQVIPDQPMGVQVIPDQQNDPSSNNPKSRPESGNKPGGQNDPRQKGSTPPSSGGR